jgi:SAM-dependent methyltransferase
MNEHHRQCGSDGWRELIREVILPWAMEEVDLGADVLEVGPGYGATTDVLADRPGALTAVEIDDELAAFLMGRYAANPSVTVVRGDATALEFADARFTGAACFTMLHHVPTDALQDRLFHEVHRVLRPGSSFVLSDSVHSDELEAHHEGDTYNPIDPTALEGRLQTAGFTVRDIKSNELGWSAIALA